MQCIGRIRTPHPWVLGRPIPCIGPAQTSLAIRPPMAQSIDELCRRYQDASVIQSTISPASSSQMSGQLLLQCLQHSREKQQLRESLASLASQLGVEADGDFGDLVQKISSMVTDSERRRREAEEKAKASEDKIRVLETQLARKERDDALLKLQDLSSQPATIFPPASSMSWSCGANPQTPSTAPLGPPLHPSHPSTPDTAPIDTITSPPKPLGTSSGASGSGVTSSYGVAVRTPSTVPLSGEAVGTPPTLPLSGVTVGTPATVPLDIVAIGTPPTVSLSGVAIGTPPTVPLSGVAVGTPPIVPLSGVAVGTPPTEPLDIVTVRTPPTVPSSAHTSSPVSAAGANSPSSTRAAAAVSSFIWDMGDLKSFHQGGGDIELGSGLNGTVHLFRHQVTNHPMALKYFVLPDDTQEMTLKARLIQSEAFILDQLGREDGFPTYLGCVQISPGKIGIAMDFIGDPMTGDSWTLSRGLRELSLTPTEWYRIALDIAKSLGQIHQKGYLMNDLKEDNCMLQPVPSGRWRAMIVDFGLACPRKEPFSFSFSSEEKEKYRRGEIYAHIAPECALDDENISIASDVFQLGRLLAVMGEATANPDLTAIGNICRQNLHHCRPTIQEVVDELDRVL